MGRVYCVHVSSFLVYFAAMLLTLLSTGAPYWYTWSEHYGGLWRFCHTFTGNTSSVDDRCVFLTVTEKVGAWRVTDALAVTSCLAGGLVTVFLMLVGCNISKSCNSEREIRVRKGVILGSTLLNLITGILLLTASLLFPWDKVEQMAEGHLVHRYWAYYTTILSGAIFILVGFLQGALLIEVTRMPIRYEMF